MSTVEQQSVDNSRNGGSDGRTFAFDNPATGETITHLPDMGTDQFFFFQAEDGIRDVAVTGVQTCALPICRSGAKRTALTVWGIGLGHGVDDYGFAGHLVIARVRDVEARGALRGAGPKSDVFPVHGTGAAESDDATVGTGQVCCVHICIVP